MLTTWPPPPRPKSATVFYIKNHSHPNGFSWGHQCSWTPANSMQVSNMQTDDCNRKYPGQRQGLNLLRPRSLGWRLKLLPEYFFSDNPFHPSRSLARGRRQTGRNRSPRGRGRFGSPRPWSRQISGSESSTPTWWSASSPAHPFCRPQTRFNQIWKRKTSTFQIECFSVCCVSLCSE